MPNGHRSAAKVTAALAVRIVATARRVATTPPRHELLEPPTDRRVATTVRRVATTAPPNRARMIGRGAKIEPIEVLEPGATSPRPRPPK